MKKRVLMIAYHYPPVQGSSGVHRSLKFSEYLPAHGWDVSVLSVHTRAYEALNPNGETEIPAGVSLTRAFALDTARHLALAGRYWSRLAIPDRWASWLLGGVVSGLAQIRRERPDVLFSTYPIATAHLIAYALHRLTGLPWVADFRDPMAQDGYPADPRRWRAYRRIEGLALRHAARSVFVTPGALAMYRARYPELPAGRLALIGNGYDEATFAGLSAPTPTPGPRPLLLLHSGVIYPSERDPGPFFEALAALRRRGQISSERLRVRLRASGHDHLYQARLDALGIADLVELAPAIPYRPALEEMLSADALLLFQAANCNQQIPAKAYEYLRAGRPVLALTDAQGDTADLLRTMGLHSLLPLDDAPAIAAGLPAFLDRLAAGSEAGADPAAAARHSRQARTAELAALLDGVLMESQHG